MIPSSDNHPISNTPQSHLHHLRRQHSGSISRRPTFAKGNFSHQQIARLSQPLESPEKVSVCSTLSIALEFLEKGHQFVPILDEDVFYLFRFSWVCDEQLDKLEVM
jgi:hypothetical protein